MSFDNKLLIKTINDEELKVFTRNLEAFYDHWMNNPNSMIARIFGVFTIKFREDEPITVFVQENIAKVDKSLIINCYDIKGSTYSRSALKRKSIPPEITNKILYSKSYRTGKTMKDNDFIKKEQSLSVSEDVKIALLKQIELDAKFFAGIGVIDYSMILFKVDRSDSKENQRLHNIYGKAPGDLLKMFRSFDSPDPEPVEDEDSKKPDSFIDLSSKTGSRRTAVNFWHAGIIDYFQVFNTQKFLERQLKVQIIQIANIGNKQDPSSMAAQPYKDRFIEFFTNRITSPLETVEEMEEEVDVEKEIRK